MLKSYFQTISPFIIIEDSLSNRGNQLFNYVLENHTTQTDKKRYFVLEGNFKRVELKFHDLPNVELYNLTNYFEYPVNIDKLNNIISKFTESDTIIFDSLGHLILQYNLVDSYKLCNTLLNNIGVRQIITILHRDLIEKLDEVIKIFQSLSTLYVSLQPKFASDKGRIKYLYRKHGTKLIEEVEEYRLENNQLITNKLTVPDKKMIEKVVTSEINPENLSTFKIGLSEVDKQSRNNLVLPYLPKSDEKKEKSSGEVFYTFDAEDDWDEEDPDDDLDI